MTTRTPDVLGEGFTSETIELADDEEGAVVATLVHHPAQGTARGAVLHVHGFSDYFFHVDFARWWSQRGYDVYALDLRKYGRSIRPHQTPNYVADLSEYHEELDEAWRRITERDGHGRCVVSAHSTGGLVVALWAHARGLAPAGMVLNSPWLDLQGAGWMRSPAARVALEAVGARQPRRIVPRHVDGLYARSLHRDHDGEWDFDLDWKPIESRPVYVGWLRAIRRGHLRLHAGLDVGCPVLVLSSLRSASPSEMGPEAHRSDLVLDVSQIRRWASAIGPHVTSIAVDGAKHDVVLSEPDVRADVYDTIGTWMDAWVDGSLDG